MKEVLVFKAKKSNDVYLVGIHQDALDKHNSESVLFGESLKKSWGFDASYISAFVYEDYQELANVEDIESYRFLDGGYCRQGETLRTQNIHTTTFDTLDEFLAIL